MTFRSYVRCVIPFFILLIINGVWSMLGAFYLTAATAAEISFSKVLVSCGYSVTALIVLYFFYYKRGFGSFELPATLRRDFAWNLKTILTLAGLSLVCFVFFSGLLSLGSRLFPELFASYIASVGSMTLSSGILAWTYSILLAPLVEELCFRGLCLTNLSRCISFWKANVVQAVLFALIHGNLIQILYAFVMGLVLGAVYKRFGGLKATILFHVLYNFFNIPLLLLL